MNFEHLTVLQLVLSLLTGLGLGLVYMYLLWKTVLYLPKAVTVGNGFLFTNLMLQKIDLPNAITIGNNFLSLPVV